jgi:hypothetical protein
MAPVTWRVPPEDTLVVVTELATYRLVRVAGPERFAALRLERPDPFEFMFEIVAVPRTRRLEPVGGAERVPIDTPFWNATFPATLVHWEEVMATFDAPDTRPY